MAKKLLRERFQQLAGIKPLYEQTSALDCSHQGIINGNASGKCGVAEKVEIVQL